MPTFRELMREGVTGDNGLLPGFPPNTGVGWHTLATGTWPSEHGSTNNTYPPDRRGQLQQPHRLRHRRACSRPTRSRSPPSEPARRSSRSSGSAPATTCPRCRGRSSTSGRSSRTAASCVNYDLPGQPAGANRFGVSYQRTGSDNESPLYNVPRSPTQAAGRTCRPSRDPAADPVPPAEHRLPGSGQRRPLLRPLHLRLDGRARPSFDHVLVVPSTAGKNGNAAIANLAQGEWDESKVTLDRREGRSDRGLLHEAHRPDVRPVEACGSTSRRSRASTPPTTSSGRLRLGSASRRRSRATSRARLRPTSRRSRRASWTRTPTSSKGLKWADAHWAYLDFIFDDLEVDADLLQLGNPVTDEFSHQFMALYTPRDIDGDPNPYFDDVENDDIPDGRVAIREGYVKSAYHEADETLELGRELMGEHDTTVFASSDHGFAPQWYAVNAGQDPGRRRDHRRREPEQLPHHRPLPRGRRPAGQAERRRSTSTSPAVTRAGSSRRLSTRRSGTRSSRPSRT